MVARVASPAFVGRHRQLAMLVEAVALRPGDQPRLVAVAGEAGIGKTRLLRELDTALTGTGSSHVPISVVFGGCLELGGGSIPFAPFVQILERLRPGSDTRGRATTEGLIDALGGLGGAADGPSAAEHGRARLFRRVRDALAAASSEGDLVIVVEDIHWADASTLDLLAFLVRSRHELPVAVVISYRSDAIHRRHPLRNWLSTLERSVAIDRIELGPLETAAVEEQVAAILGHQPSPSDLTRVVDIAEGNPFFVEEIVASRGLAPGSLAPSLRDVMLARVDGLGETAVDVLRAASVIGRDWSERLVTIVLDAAPARTRAALREAVDAFLLEPSPDGRTYRFRHALLREAVYEDILPGDRVDLHERIAATLDAMPELAAAGPAAAAAERALHLVASHQLVPAFGAYVAAGHAAQAASAWTEARDAFAMASELRRRPEVVDATGGVIEQIDLLSSLGLMEYMAGSPRTALGSYRSAIALAGDGRDDSIVLLFATAARVASECGAWEDMERFASEATLRATNTPTIGLVRALEIAAGIEFQMSRNAEAIAAIDRLEAVASDVTDTAADVAVAQGLTMRALANAQLGHARAAFDDLDRAAQLIERAGDMDSRGWVLTNGAVTLATLGRFAESAALAADGIAESRREGLLASWGPWLAPIEAESAFWIGASAQARSALAAVAEIDTGTSSNQSVMRIRAQTLIDAAAGDASVVARIAAEADRQEPNNLPDQIADLRTAAAFAAVWHGRPDIAIEHVLRGLRSLEGTDGAVSPAWLLLAGMRAAADSAARARARGDDDSDAVAQASAWFDMAASLADGSYAPSAAPGPFPAMVLKLVEPELDRALGRDEPDTWLSTASAAMSMSLPQFAADAYRHAAELLLVAGDRSGARSALGIGAATAREIGSIQALRDIEALAARSRLDLAIGLEAVDPGDHGAAPVSPDPWGLSERERDVLALLAEGRTNRQIGDALFISDKTASVHVTHILAKMGVSSRTEAALLAARASTGSASIGQGET